MRDKGAQSSWERGGAGMGEWQGGASLRHSQESGEGVSKETKGPAHRQEVKTNEGKRLKRQAVSRRVSTGDVSRDGVARESQLRGVHPLYYPQAICTVMSTYAAFPTANSAHRVPDIYRALVRGCCVPAL